MITFKEFLLQFENLWGDIPGNPAFGGKKPSDGLGAPDPYNVNRPGQSAASASPAGPQTPPGAKMMKKKMKKG